jgi:glutaminyl-tRNA synthetase
MHGIATEVRLYDRLFKTENPDVAPEGMDFRANLNPDSLEVITGIAEPGLASVSPGEKYQFQRLGYFCVDTDSTEGQPVFNRTVTLRDSWSRNR